MNLRVAILALADEYNLSPAAGRRLKELAGFAAPPPALPRYLPWGMAILAVVLIGLGMIFWVAANWATLPRSGRFIVLEATVLCTLLAAWRLPLVRMPLSLLGFLACGALFACFGQIYQTGADPWQLFALWALLVLPLCMSVRHEALWVAWVMVALTAAQLFSQVQTNGWWWDSDISLQTSLGSWLPALALALLFALLPRPWTGAGHWPARLSMIYAVIGLVTMSVRSLFSPVDHGFYPMSLLIVAVLAVAFSRRKLFDIFILSVLGLGVNVLLVCGMAERMLVFRGTEVAALLLIGSVSAALLAGTVKLIVHLARTQAGEHLV